MWEDKAVGELPQRQLAGFGGFPLLAHDATRRPSRALFRSLISVSSSGAHQLKTLVVGKCTFVDSSLGPVDRLVILEARRNPAKTAKERCNN